MSGNGSGGDRRWPPGTIGRLGRVGFRFYIERLIFCVGFKFTDVEICMAYFRSETNNGLL